MSKITTLFGNEWLSLKKKTMDNGSEYVYSSAEWCGSQGVAVLPYRTSTIAEAGEFHWERTEYLGRIEICPAHSDDIELCSITGGMDKEGESPVFTAVRELIEEGGYEVPVENMIFLGTVRPSKASDNTMHLFAVDIDKSAKEVVATTDGTLGEEGMYCDWISLNTLMRAKDPLLHTMYLRLNDYLGGLY